MIGCSRVQNHPISKGEFVATSDQVDLNSASKEKLDEIDELKGHGHEIVRYREERGGFTRVEQLDEVPGLTGKVGSETMKRLKVGRR